MFGHGTNKSYCECSGSKRWRISHNADRVQNVHSKTYYQYFDVLYRLHTTTGVLWLATKLPPCSLPIGPRWRLGSDHRLHHRNADSATRCCLRKHQQPRTFPTEVGAVSYIMLKFHRVLCIVFYLALIKLIHRISRWWFFYYYENCDSCY